MTGNRTKIVKFWACIVALGLSSTVTFPLHSSATASIVQPSHLSRFQSARPPQGFREVCKKYAWACSNRAGGSITTDNDVLAIARTINSGVNRKIRQVPDQVLFGVAERWTLPTSGAGDCEDIALLKLKQLVDAGVAPNRLFLAQVLSRNLQQHVVLVVRTKRGDYILDNLTSRIKTWQQTGYTFIKMQNSGNARKWDAVLLGPRARRH